VRVNRETHELRAARSRLLRFTWIVVGSIVAGTIGYAATTGEGIARSAYMTLETLSYLGRQQKQGAALWVQITLLHVGTLFTWYAGWLVVDLAMDRHFGRHFWEMRRMKKVETMAKHVVICGGGRVGVRLAEVLAARSEPFVIIETDGEATQALKEKGYLVVEGDARDESVQRTAGVARARMLFAALPVAEQNVIVLITAGALNESIEMHARSERADYAPKLVRAGASSVVLPEVACADGLIAGAFKGERAVKLAGAGG
jgi:voltage-gated potassium channel